MALAEREVTARPKGVRSDFLELDRAIRSDERRRDAEVAVEVERVRAAATWT
jgi:hypothetical protein